MQLATIGFTRSSAAHFFGRLREAGVQRVVDVRLHKSSQLAGFAKQPDLAYFLDALGGIGYVDMPDLAPTPELLARYRQRAIDWDTYAAAYLDLIDTRRVHAHLDPHLFDGGCLLCSEHVADRCHRRLAADYLAERWGGMRIAHL
ncbi:DUF488 domain-containing protein [Lysobacter humi (ex Lee et al. 2017)]